MFPKTMAGRLAIAQSWDVVIDGTGWRAPFQERIRHRWHLQLLDGSSGKYACGLLYNGLVLVNRILKSFYGQFIVKLCPAQRFWPGLFEEVMLNAHYHVAIHLDKTTVRVPSKAGVPRL